jgi:creatinine amidohydrolase/Fe(II)-dependent formamide hydrolase-like protein
MFLGKDYVRKDRIVAGSPDNGITGDPRRSSAELGKRVFDMKVDYGAREILRLTEGRP